MLSTGFIEECLLVKRTLPAFLSFTFCLQRPFGVSLISLVWHDDGSYTSSLSLLMGSCSKETSLGCQLELLFFPLYGLRASRYRREDAVTAALSGREFSLYSMISLESPSRSFSCQGSVPVVRFLSLAAHP